ncbi:UNVERIFIED_CONTAM: hypothetical protein FQV16_0014594, partial [Eudyptes robustus]
PPPQAVCCRDHQHCCPRGYTCNVATQSCEKLLAPTPLLRTPTPPRRAPTPPPALLRAASTEPGAAVPCDAARSCRGGQRCCWSRRGSWGCCPFAQVSLGYQGGGLGGITPPLPPSSSISLQGSCCSDGRHCCPRGSHCTGGGWGCSPQRWDLP